MYFAKQTSVDGYKKTISSLYSFAPCFQCDLKRLQYCEVFRYGRNFGRIEFVCFLNLSRIIFFCAV
jgi:hypothetical protein